MLDGVPENTAIGVSFQAEQGSLGIVLLAAVFLGNLVTDHRRHSAGERSHDRDADDGASGAALGHACPPRC